MAKNIYLIGFMGSGKTTIAGALEKKYHYRHTETDRRIEEREGMPVREIFSRQGEEAFRCMETELLRELALTGDTVISCGGGMALRRENVELMKKNGIVILLTAQPDTILERVKGSTSRPLLNGHMNTEYIAELMAERRPAYLAAADAVVETDGRSAEDIAAEVYRYAAGEESHD